MSRAPPPGLCRDCAVPAPPAAVRCPGCASPRLLFHAELHDLAIAHVDCDAFFASIEKRDRPELRDRPVIVGGGRRGVVSTACYIARTRGVHSAMPMYAARRACPEAVVIRPRMAAYVAAGHAVRRILQSVSPLVQPLSIDEAFLDLAGTARLHGASPAVTLVRVVRRIEEEVGVTASVGLSHNRFLAKLASDFDKPRGFSVIGRAETLAVLAPLPVSRIRGVGAALQRRLAADGITAVGQLQRRDEAGLTARYGSTGRQLFRLARGEDDSAVTAGGTMKTVSAETTFDADIADAAGLRARLWPLCERVSERLKAGGVAGRTVTLKLKTADFRSLTRSRSLAAPTRLAETLYREALPLIERAADGTAYRLIGIGVSRLGDGAGADPPDLVDAAGRRRRVEGVIDAVRARLGRSAIARGRGLALDFGHKSP